VGREGEKKNNNKKNKKEGRRTSCQELLDMRLDLRRMLAFSRAKSRNQGIGNTMCKRTRLTRSAATSHKRKNIVYAQDTSETERPCHDLAMRCAQEVLTKRRIVNEDFSGGDLTIARGLCADKPDTSAADFPTATSVRTTEIVNHSVRRHARECITGAGGIVMRIKGEFICERLENLDDLLY